MSKATLHYSRPRLPRRLARQQHPGLKSKLELTAVCDDNSHHYYQLSFCLSEQRFVGLEIILKNYFYVSMNGWVKCFGLGGVGFRSDKYLVLGWYIENSVLVSGPFF